MPKTRKIDQRLLLKKVNLFFLLGADGNKII